MNSQINLKWGQQVSPPNIAGIGFVIEIEMKCFVFDFFALFYCRLRSWSFACDAFHCLAGLICVHLNTFFPLMSRF